MQKLKVAILGSGNIGTDLLIKVLRSDYLKCVAFVGRNLSSPGMMKAQNLGIPVSAESIQYFLNHPQPCDLVFDCTSAKAHLEHAKIFNELGIRAIDLTPAKVGEMCVPGVNMDACLTAQNINMITCGGQASIPLVYVIGQLHPQIDYIEVVSSIASRSAGPATRRNLDEYIHTTELAIKHFSGALRAKAILNLNPALPCIDMQTTVFAKVHAPNIAALITPIAEMEKNIQQYVPGYQIILHPKLENDRIAVMVRVKGMGDYLPSYAGNLDIINCAAVAVAEHYAVNKTIAIKETAHERAANFSE